MACLHRITRIAVAPNPGKPDTPTERAPVIKHVSFDVWNTLVKPNPEFAKRRTRLLALSLGREEEFVRRAYTHVKGVVDTAAEHEGAAFSTPDVYALLFASCGLSVAPERASEIRLAIDDIFREHPPIIVLSVVALMQWLRGRGVTTSIASNSNFVSGDVMHPFLEGTLSHRFELGIYSDRIMHGKPSPAFFDRVFEGLREMSPTIDRAEVLHVGDHPLCDLRGAQAAGMHGLLIESPDLLCEQVMLRMDT